MSAIESRLRSVRQEAARERERAERAEARVAELRTSIKEVAHNEYQVAKWRDQYRAERDAALVKVSELEAILRLDLSERDALRDAMLHIVMDERDAALDLLREMLDSQVSIFVHWARWSDNGNAEDAAALDRHSAATKAARAFLSTRTPREG